MSERCSSPDGPAHEHDRRLTISLKGPEGPIAGSVGGPGRGGSDPASFSGWLELISLIGAAYRRTHLDKPYRE